MENMLHIGSKIDKDFAENLTNSLITIMKTGAEQRLSDEVILKAISSFKEVAEVKNVNINNCCFDSSGEAKESQ